MKSIELLMVADFETTVYNGQTFTECWSCASAFLNDNTDNVEIQGNLTDFMRYLFSFRLPIRLWFHNLKFDGTFIIDWLLRHGYRFQVPDNRKKLPTKTFTALISSKRRFYTIKIRTYENVTITLCDSVKLIPFSLSEAAKAFKTKCEKLDMEYVGKRYANCPISLKERCYIINDVLVLKEIMEILLARSMDRLTIGSVCVKDFKSRFDKFEWGAYFPDLRNTPCEVDSNLTTESYVRKTYKGAWCYLKKPGKYYYGKTFDVNSLYPSVMHSKSGNYYPVGQPHYFKSDIPDICNRVDIVYFVHIKCRFELKENYLPTIQIKNSFLYPPQEWLTSSNFKIKGNYYSKTQDKNGQIYEAYPELYLTMKDYELLLKHYNVFDLVILDGCWFTGVLGLFDEYIDKWMNLKINTKDKVERTIDKLYLNNLYGKLASSDDASYLKPFIGKDTDAVEYELVNSNDKDVFYIPAGSMVTSYARYFTITHSQDNYEAFIYADTDSIHCLDVAVKGINIHPTDLLCWKQESTWDKAIFIRQKTYTERVIESDGKLQPPMWNVTCAGMPKASKEKFLEECFKGNMSIEDFKVGLSIGGKLVPKNIKGGQILVERNFTIHKK